MKASCCYSLMICKWFNDEVKEKYSIQIYEIQLLKLQMKRVWTHDAKNTFSVRYGNKDEKVCAHDVRATKCSQISMGSCVGSPNTWPTPLFPLWSSSRFDSYILHICHNHHNRWLCKKNQSSVKFSNGYVKETALILHTMCSFTKKSV